MRKVAIITLVSCLVVAFIVIGLSVSFAGPQEIKPPPIKKPIPSPLKPIPLPPQRPCEGPDPAVISQKVIKSIVVRNGVKIGVLRITSTLKNVGTQDFVSRPGQQGFVIQAKNPDISGPRAYESLASKDFTRLNKGASITLTATYEIPHIIEWGHRTPRFGECKAERVIMSFVSYDPDILLDSNPQNDDCGGTGPAQGNNMKRHTIRYMVECPW